MIYGWSPGIGDPDVLGWATVAAYLVAAGLCARAGRTTGARRFWLALTVALVALGINKQLDLQSALTAIARHAFETEGWYAERRGAQAAFVGAVAGAGVVLLGIVAARMRRSGPAERLAILGLVALVTFVIVRAASFHHVDLLLALGVGGVRVNHVLELGGIGIIAAAALRAGGVRPYRPASAPSRAGPKQDEPCSPCDG